MEIDLRRPAALNAGQQRSIADTMHLLLLQDIMATGGWKPRQIAFQGGTSLKLAWGSSRFSEDLDFLVGTSAGDGERLTAIMRRAAHAVERKLASVLPGGAIELTVPKDPEASLLAFSVNWGHPNVRGKVKVKVEYFRVESRLIAQYGIEARAVTPKDGDDLLMRIQTMVPASDLPAIMLDKVYALGGRDYTKIRDLYDIWYLNQVMRDHLDDDRMRAGLELRLEMYHHDPSDIIEKWRRLPEILPDAEAISTDLARWLSPEDHAILKVSNGFERMRSDAIAFALRAAEIMRPSSRPGP